MLRHSSHKQAYEAQTATERAALVATPADREKQLGELADAER